MSERSELMSAQAEQASLAALSRSMPVVGRKDDDR